MKGHIKEFIDFNLLSFDEICKKVREGEHFSFARYGDGEFAAIMGTDGVNTDGHPYCSEMGKELWTTFQKAKYFTAVHQGRMNWRETYKLLKAEKETRRFVSNAVFHCATRDGLFDQFWDALKGKRVVIIAPKYIRSQIVVNASKFIEIPGRETYSHLSQIKSDLDQFDFTDSVCLICASMTAPLIVDYLHETYENKATFIDFGSSVV